MAKNAFEKPNFKTKAGVLGPVEPKVGSELEKFIKEESRMVKGRFKNYETPGGNLPLTCGKYPGQPIFNKVLQDGQVYEVPLWVARHLNGIDVTAKSINGQIGSCSYPIHGFKWDAGKSAPESQMGADGTPVPVVTVAKRTQRYGFESLDFSSNVA